MSSTREAILTRFKWQQVVAPRAWHPRLPGEELVGYYGGKTIRNGAYGQYDVAIVHVPGDGAYTVSGVNIINLIDAALITDGHPIRIVWQGNRLLQNGKTIKQFDVFVADGDPIPAPDLPTVTGPRVAD
jgi:hypothetical protein